MWGDTSAPTAAPEKTEPVMKALENGEVALVKSEGANPIVGNSDTGEYIYGGDPSVLVDGDTGDLLTTIFSTPQRIWSTGSRKGP